MLCLDAWGKIGQGRRASYNQIGSLHIHHSTPHTMLKGISPVISPELLAVLCRMGHGDEIVLADANFPGEMLNQPNVLVISS